MGSGLSCRLLVPPAFPGGGRQAACREPARCGAVVGPAVLQTAAVEQKVKAVQKKHHYVLPCLMWTTLSR
ncbi:hypothetical protein ARTHRO9AX_150065 [Arthrobacter sp. 9AX]|nr:hypothetical protein ARTHRO9AX_150065 [Arthrobacter sp. 9AX]